MPVKPLLALVGIFYCMVGTEPPDIGPLAEPLKIASLIGLVGYMLWNQYKERSRMAETLDKKDAIIIAQAAHLEALHIETMEVIRKCTHGEK